MYLVRYFFVQFYWRPQIPQSIFAVQASQWVRTIGGQQEEKIILVLWTYKFY